MSNGSDSMALMDTVNSATSTEPTDDTQPVDGEEVLGEKCIFFPWARYLRKPTQTSWQEWGGLGSREGETRPP